MKNLCRTSLICIVVLLSGSLFAQNTARASVNTLEDKIYGLSLIWSELKYNFVGIDQLDFDLDSLYRETMKRVIDTKDDVEYYKELSRFLNRMNDAHTELFDYPESGYEETDYPNYGTQYIDGKYYFIKYKKDCPYSDPELLGAEIIEVGGMPTAQYVEQYVLPHKTGSTLKYKLKWAGATMLNGTTGTYIHGKARLTDGRIKTFSAIRNGESIRTDDDVWLPETKSYYDAQQIVTLNWHDNIAHLKIGMFYPETVSDNIDSAMTEIHARPCQGVIIDLRGNGGGITPVAWRLQMYLTPSDSIRSFGSQTRINSGYGRAQGNWMEEYEDYYLYRAYSVEQPEMIAVPRDIERLTCPVVILMDAYSFSACEDFLINIYEMPGRPTLIGETTAGSTGAPLVIELPHKAVARICTLRALYPYSLKPFAGGINPDIEIIPTLDDILQGNDPAKQKALEILNNSH